jgi:hypothetical protein
MRRAMAWQSIVNDDRLQQQLTNAQEADAKDKAKTSREGGLKAVRLAWSHVLFPVKTEATTAGTPFDLEHLSISAKDRAAIPSTVYEKVKNDGIAKEKLGPDALWLHLQPLWPSDKTHLSISEIADWFATYVYLPKLRDRVVLETAIREAVAKLDPMFGYADSFDATSAHYQGLIWAKAPPQFTAPGALLVRKEIALEQLPLEARPTGGDPGGTSTADEVSGGGRPATRTHTRPARFYGSVELDMLRPVKAFDAILNAIVMELQRTKGAKVRLTLEVEATAPDGFADSDVGVVRDNARQLKFKSESTGFE